MNRQVDLNQKLPQTIPGRNALYSYTAHAEFAFHNPVSRTLDASGSASNVATPRYAEAFPVAHARATAEDQSPMVLPHFISDARPR